MRVIEKKRPPFMTKKKWLALITIILCIVILFIILMYRSINKDYWQQQRNVYSVIEQHGQYVINSDTELVKYVWDQPYWMLLTENSAGQLIYSVWDEEQLIDEVAYEQIVSSEQLLSTLKTQKPSVNSFSVQSGYLYGRFVWEVQYRDPKTDHVKLAFYHMNDGKLIDEYTIPKETRP